MTSSQLSSIPCIAAEKKREQEDVLLLKFMLIHMRFGVEEETKA